MVKDCAAQTGSDRMKAHVAEYDMAVVESLTELSAMLALILTILVRKGLTTEAEVKELRATALRAIFGRDEQSDEGALETTG